MAEGLNRNKTVFSGPMQIILGVNFFPIENYVNIHKVWITTEPMQNMQAGLTVSVEEAMQISAWLQELLIKIDEIKE